MTSAAGSRRRSRIAASLGSLCVVCLLFVGQASHVSASSGINLDPSLSIVQDMNLDCEAAALAAALTEQRVTVNTGGQHLQNWVFNALPKENYAPQGDPYSGFVGNVNGAEGFGSGTGYGVYYAPIAAVANSVSESADAHTGWTTRAIEAEIVAGRPVVVWIDYRSLTTHTGFPLSHWTAADGRSIPYTLHEHAVTVLGTTPGQNVTLLDPHSGHQLTYSEGQFSAMLTTFGGMGVSVGPGPKISGVSSASGPVSGGATVTVSGSGFASGMTASIGGREVTPSAVSSTAFSFITPPGPAWGNPTVQIQVAFGGTSSPLGAADDYTYLSSVKAGLRLPAVPVAPAPSQPGVRIAPALKAAGPASPGQLSVPVANIGPRL